MHINEIFETSARQQAEIIEQQQQNALDQKGHQQKQAEQTLKNAKAINERFQSGLNYLRAQEYPAAEQNHYDIQHHFQFSRTFPTEQLYTTLCLYMRRGGVVTMLGSDPPYQSRLQTYAGWR